MDMYDKFEKRFEPVEGSPFAGTPVQGAQYQDPSSDPFGYSIPSAFEAPKPEPVFPKHKVSAINVIALLAGIFFVAYAFLIAGGKAVTASSLEKQDVSYATAANEAVYYDIYLLSDPFYQFEDGYKLYLAFDENFYAAVLAIRDEDFGRNLQAINEFTFSDEQEGPGTLHMEGISEVIPADAASYAVQYYNSLSNEEVIADDGVDYSYYFGEMMLRYAPNEVLPVHVDMEAAGALVLGGALLVIGAIICLFRNRKRFKKMTEEKVYNI